MKTGPTPMRSVQFLWYEAASPADYAAMAKEWGLPCCAGDFEKTGGFKR